MIHTVKMYSRKFEIVSLSERYNYNVHIYFITFLSPCGVI
jgi:hypothetical protein